jgi:hypothetical protein
MNQILQFIFAMLIVWGLCGIGAQVHAAENGDQRYLTMLVREAVSQKDYDRARRLAVTPEHYELIAGAQQRDADAKAAAAAARRQATSQTCVVIQNMIHCR